MMKSLMTTLLAGLLGVSGSTGCSYREARSLAKAGGIMLVAGAVSGAVAASRTDGSQSLDTIGLAVAGGLFATGGLIVGAGGLIGMGTASDRNERNDLSTSATASR